MEGVLVLEMTCALVNMDGLETSATLLDFHVLEKSQLKEQSVVEKDNVHLKSLVLVNLVILEVKVKFGLLLHVLELLQPISNKFVVEREFALQ